MNDDNLLSSSETNGFHLTMPLFELFGDSSRRNLDDATQEKPTDVSFIPESDFAELIWENGQLMMQGGQSSRGRKPPSYYNSSTSTQHTRDRGDALLVATNNCDAIGISSSSDRYRSGVTELPPQICDDDDIFPWFNSPINDILPEISGITDNFNFMKKKNNVKNNYHPCANDGVHFPSHGVKGSEATGSGMTSTSNAARGDSTRFPNTSNLVNFSHFSRRNNSAIPNPGPSDMERVVFSSKQSAQVNASKQPPCSNNSEGIPPEDILNAGASTSRDPQDALEPVVASSVCSGNGLDIASDDPTCNLKRKSRDTYDSEAPSDDVEEDSVGLRKAGTARGNSSKRGRAAEVHNLSERRRRDRINEKMRALQELIPNCNKVDKASMLDEAIEYLKTLQIQVQIMSMGSGMYMPPMMFPGGMHPAHMAQIQAMGVGMASGLGFRMGMVEPNSGMMMQGTHFPNPYMSVGPSYPVIGVPPGPMSMQQQQRPPMIPFAVQRPASGIIPNNDGSMDGAVAAATTMPIADSAVASLTNPPQTQGQAKNGGGLEQSRSSRNPGPGDDSSS